jgi:hypothetical protein
MMARKAALKYLLIKVLGLKIDFKEFKTKSER